MSTNVDIMKFHRGQVWVIRFKDQNEPKGHEQQKDRPWLVISTAIYNHTSGMITCVPLTSRTNTETPAQVHLTNNRGQDNIILCEQIRSFDCMCGAYSFDYVGMVNDNILEAVDVALSIHLGMHYSPVTLDTLYKSMEAVVKSVAYMQGKSRAYRFTDDDILEFATKLEQLTIKEVNKSKETPKVEEPQINKYTNPLDITRGIPEDEEVVEKNPESKSLEYRGFAKVADTSPSPIVLKGKSKRFKWTVDLCKKFLDEASTLPMKEVMERWGISEKTKFYYLKNYTKSRLNEMK